MILEGERCHDTLTVISVTGSGHLGLRRIGEGRFMPPFSPANLYTGRGYAKTSIILKDERRVIFWDGSSVPIILEAFEGWTGQVMKRTRESKDRENAAGTYGMFCLHSTRIVSFLGRGWCDWKDHTFVSSSAGFLARWEPFHYRFRAANKVP